MVVFYSITQHPCYYEQRGRAWTWIEKYNMALQHEANLAWKAHLATVDQAAGTAAEERRTAGIRIDTPTQAMEWISADTPVFRRATVAMPLYEEY